MSSPDLFRRPSTANVLPSTPSVHLHLIFFSVFALLFLLIRSSSPTFGRCCTAKLSVTIFPKGSILLTFLILIVRFRLLLVLIFVIVTTIIWWRWWRIAAVGRIIGWRNQPSLPCSPSLLILSSSLLLSSFFLGISWFGDWDFLRLLVIVAFLVRWWIIGRGGIVMWWGGFFF